MGNRYYDPMIGRFISRAPVKSGTNWYAYGENDPVNNMDPLGLQSEFGGGGSGGNDAFSYASGVVFAVFVAGPQKTADTVSGWFGWGGSKPAKAVERFSVVAMDALAANHADFVASKGFWSPENITQMMVENVVTHTGGMSTGARGIAAIGARGTATALPNGLRGASEGLKGTFAGGGVSGKSIIGIRSTLLKDGFTMTKTGKS